MLLAIYHTFPRFINRHVYSTNPRYASHNLPISLFLFLYAFVKRPLCMHEKTAVFFQKLARFFQKAASFPTKHNYT